MIVSLLLICISWASLAPVSGKQVHYLHWNQGSPVFQTDNTEHIVDVQEFDQVNIICPVSKPGMNVQPEQHVIYSVNRAEFDNCRITNPKPKIVAICNQPYRLMYFTITFRSFTPTPGGLEFHPGQDYYFISTSTHHDLHRRVGGGCATHNMRMMFKMSPSDTHAIESDNAAETTEMSSDLESHLNTIADVAPVKVPRYYHKTLSRKMPNPDSAQDVFYYHPKDVITWDSRPQSTARRVVNPAPTPMFTNFETVEKVPDHRDNEVLEEKPAEFTSYASNAQVEGERESFQRHRLLGAWSPFISVTATSGATANGQIPGLSCLLLVLWSSLFLLRGGQRLL